MENQKCQDIRKVVERFKLFGKYELKDYETALGDIVDILD